MSRQSLSIGIGVIVLVVGLLIFLFLRGGIDENFENASISVDPIIGDDNLSDFVVFPQEETDPPLAKETRPPSSQVPSPSPEKKEASPSPKSEFEVVPELIAFGYRVPQSPRNIDTIVLHSSYNASGGDVYDIEKIIRQYEEYGVGAHYLIGRDGTIYRLVEEKDIAYHAGVSKMPDGRKNVNDFSIGIELVATETSGFTGKQYVTLSALLADIKERYTIKNTVGHSDIAPGRKTDPWQFDWTKLSK